MRLRFAVILAIFLTLLSGATLAQIAGPAQTEASAPVTSNVTAYTLPPDKLAKAHILYVVHTTLHFVETIYGIVLLLLILRFRLGAKFRDLAERVTRMRYVQAWIVVTLLTLLIDVLSLPFSIYSHSLSLKYGLSIQRWGSWFWDWTKSEVIGIAVGVQLIALLYWLIYKSPRRWWLYSWAALLPIMVFVIFVVPVVLDPLFNKFEPLERNHADLVHAIHKVTERGGLEIAPDRMFLMLASEKVTTANAYVTGIGATKRVVVWDTTTQQMTIPQALFVFGHEMGHYVLRHITKGLIFAAIMLFFGFWIAFHLIHWLLAKWGSSWQVRDLPDWASLPALLLIASLLGFVAEPIGNTFTRHIEHQADVYGLNITRGINPDYRQTAAQSFQNLGEHSLSYPYPGKLMIFWLYSHPDISSRVQFALHYEPGQE